MTVNLAYGDATTVMDVYEQLLGMAKELVPGVATPAPNMAPPRSGDVRHSLADVRAAEEHFDFSPTVGFAEGLRQTFTWYLAQMRTEQPNERCCPRGRPR